MKISVMRDTAKRLRKGVIFGIVLTAVVGFVYPKAQSQTPYQQEQERERQQKERQEQQRQAEQRREEQKAERERQAQQQREEQQQPTVVPQRPQQEQPQPLPRNPNVTPNYTPNKYTPAPPPATVYTPRSSSGSTAGGSSGSATEHRSSTTGTTVYIPHASSGGTTPAASSSGPTTVKGTTVYTPHSSSSAGGGSTMYRPTGTGAAVYSPHTASAGPQEGGASGVKPERQLTVSPRSTEPSVAKAADKAAAQLPPVLLHAAGSQPAPGQKSAVKIAACSAACMKNPAVSEYAAKCGAGSASSCYHAAAALCECNLSSGGCGNDTKKLQSCITENTHDALALMK